MLTWYCSGFHGDISVKAEIPLKWFDLCAQILIATMAICYANTIVDTYPLKPLFQETACSMLGVISKHENQNLIFISACWESAYLSPCPHNIYFDQSEPPPY